MWRMRVCVCLALGGVVSAQNEMIPGKLVCEPPTLICLGIVWYIQGDENYNATGEIAYRKAGEEAWHQGLPLLRVDPRNLYEGRKIEPALAGSLFDLEPGTEYEVRVKVSDPDGGTAEQTFRQRTRPVPETPRDARQVHVVPGDGGGTGTKEDPFKGLAAAARAVRPGDLVLVHAGVYKCPVALRTNGEPGKPITYRGAGDGEAILEAAEDANVVEVYGTRHLIFEYLTVRNGLKGFQANGAEDLTVRRCRILNCQFGVRSIDTNNPGKNFYIADNVIEFKAVWPRSKPDPRLEPGEEFGDSEGVEIVGSGHAVCYNRISNFDDCVSTRGPAYAIDFYNNDLRMARDDALELDYSTHNVRAFRNRITNCFMGISTQPLFGGPAYIIRNVMYNLGADASPLRLHNEPSGVIILHNTILKAGQALQSSGKGMRNVLMRNNLFFGRDRYSMEFCDARFDGNTDYDGFYKTEDPDRFVKWKNVKYRTLAELAAATGNEKHGVLVGLDIFASAIGWPNPDDPVEPADLRLRAGSAAVDAGTVLPNVNDRFRGRAPDLGAYEVGDDLPVYGPRPE